MAIVNGYCTLAQLKTELGVADTADDSTLEMVITAVSREIDRHCGRRFYAVNETRYYTPSSCSIVLVDDVLSASALETDNDGDRVYETTWTTADYDLGPDNAPADGEPYWHIAPSPLGAYALPVGIRRGLRLTGSFGYSASAPAVVQQACLFQAALAMRSKDAPLGVSGGQEGFRQEVVSVGLHPFARRLLSDFVRRPVG